MLPLIITKNNCEKIIKSQNWLYVNGYITERLFIKKYKSLCPERQYTDSWWCFAKKDEPQAGSEIGHLIFVVIKDVLDEIDKKVISRLMGKPNVSCKQILFEKKHMTVKDIIKNGGLVDRTNDKVAVLNGNLEKWLLRRGAYITAAIEKNIVKLDKKLNVAEKKKIRRDINRFKKEIKAQKIVKYLVDKLEKEYACNHQECSSDKNLCVDKLAVLKDDIDWLTKNGLLNTKASDIIKEGLCLGYMKESYPDYVLKSDIDLIGEDKSGSPVYYEIKFLNTNVPRDFSDDLEDSSVLYFYIDYFQFAKIGRMFEECGMATKHVILRKDKKEDQICQFIKDNEESKLRWLLKSFNQIEKISKSIYAIRNSKRSGVSNDEYYYGKNQGNKIWFTWGMQDEDSATWNYNYKYIEKYLL